MFQKRATRDSRKARDGRIHFPLSSLPPNNGESVRVFILLSVSRRVFLESVTS